MEHRHRPIPVKAALLAICSPLCSPATDCAAPLRQNHRSRSRVLDQGPEGEAESVNPVFDGKLRRYPGRARARPLPALDSLLRSIGASFQAPDICRLFLLLRQKKRPRPRRLSWRNSLRKYFKVDPLVDRQGQALRWVGRLNPAKSTPCIRSGG